MGVDEAHPSIIRNLQDSGIHAEPISFRQNPNEMTEYSVLMVQNGSVTIHPKFDKLIGQLRTVRYNEKGHPDKQEFSLDLGDCFITIQDNFCKIRMVKITKSYTINIKKDRQKKPACGWSF